MKLKHLLLLVPVLLGIGIAQASYSPRYPIRPASVLDLGWEAVMPEKKTAPVEAVVPSETNSPKLDVVPRIVHVNSAILKLINQARANSGLSMVAESATLTAQAQAQNNWMIAGGGLNHRGYPYEIIGYNYGYANPEVQVVNAWIDSPGHAHIMFGAFTQAGCAEDVSGGTYWFSCEFK